MQIDESQVNLPENGRLLLLCKNGHVKETRKVADDEHVASLNALIDLAKLAGYKIVSPEGNTL